ncbi:MAG: hypothetical protein Q9161_006519 [Pseudevernia consocians]
MLVNPSTTESLAHRQGILPIKNLSAELQSAKENLLVIGTEEEIARLYANAIILLNVTLRQAVQDLRLELSREKDGAQMQRTQTQRETIWDLPKKEAPRNDLKDADKFAASAYEKETEEDLASQMFTMDVTSSHNKSQDISSGGTNRNCELPAAGIVETFEFPAPGPVTLTDVPGPITPWDTLESDHDSSGDDSKDEHFEDRAGPMCVLDLDESESNGCSGVQEEINGPSQDGFSPQLNDSVNGLYDVSDDEDEFVMPAPPPNTAGSSSHSSVCGSVCGDDDDREDHHGGDDDEDDGGVVAQSDNTYKSKNGTVEAVHLRESVGSVGAYTPNGDADAEGVNRADIAYESLEGSLVTAEEQKNSEEGETLVGSAISGTLQVTCEDYEKQDDHEPRNVVA